MSGYWPNEGQVVDRTGKSYKEWFDLLDAWGAESKDHKTIAAYLGKEIGINLWWAQNVTVEYERTKGRREIGMTSRGFEAGVTRTIASNVDDIWDALTAAAGWDRWFSSGSKLDFRPGGTYSNEDKDMGTFKSIAPKRRFTFTWMNVDHCPHSEVAVEIYDLDDGKCRVSLTHSKLDSQAEREEMKLGWTWAMDQLKNVLEGRERVSHDDWLAASKQK